MERSIGTISTFDSVDFDPELWVVVNGLASGQYAESEEQYCF